MFADAAPMKNRVIIIPYLTFPPSKFRQVYMKFEEMNINKDVMMGTRIEGSLLTQNPKIGENMN
jgi:hypothetical protein